MKKLFRALLIVMLVVGSTSTTQAQEDEDKKIRIKITKEIDGQRKTFEGEYANEEEMRSDPAYREFAGEDNDFTVWFGDEDMDNLMQFHHGPGGRGFSFGFDDDEFFGKNFLKNFQFHGGPGAFFFGDDEDLPIIDLRKWNSQEYEEVLNEKMEALEQKLNELDEKLRDDIMESVKEIQEMQSSMVPPKRIKRNGISISDVGDDFGKKAKVSPDEMLELEDMNLFVMRNKLNLRFRVKDQGELSVKISNEQGKDIYSRYFESFGGTFSDIIDFANYSEGKYLLEIRKDEKRLVKKIVID